MTSDGGVKLRRAIEKQKIVHIEKLIVAVSASGPFLQKITNFVDTVIYNNYRDATFFVPNDNTISEIDIISARTTRAFIAGSNVNLESFSIDQCLIDRLPPTLPKMTKLKILSIRRCMLTVLRLDMFVENQNLNYLDLSSNQIRQLIPITGRPTKTLSIGKLYLVGNLLERLDMALFVAMPLLSELYITNNRIVTLDVSAPVALPNLSDLYLGYNKIVSLDLRNLTLPKLESFSFGHNALTRMPILPRPLPKFNYISLFANNLIQLDMTYFRPYPNLQRIYINSNQITTVRASSPVRLPVVYLGLSDNKITTFNITGWGMPNITLLDLDGNRLTVVPSVFERYSKVVLVMNRNPLSCNALSPFKDRLKNDQLQKEQRPLSMVCTTTSSFAVDETIKVCCDK
uniref:Leucine rich immune protein (Coil-less) n=1 Tax=Anopheles quadriannulatus TaxID=34691 RepID=A0A1I8JVW3_ANOQN